MKVVINEEYGGFYLDQKHVDYLIKEKGWFLTKLSGEASLENGESTMFYPPFDITCAEIGETHISDVFGDKRQNLEFKARTHPDIVEVVEKLMDGKDTLKVVEIPDGINVYVIPMDMGGEIIHEVHRTWY